MWTFKHPPVGVMPAAAGFLNRCHGWLPAVAGITSATDRRQTIGTRELPRTGGDRDPRRRRGQAGAANRTSSAVMRCPLINRERNSFTSDLCKLMPSVE